MVGIGEFGVEVGDYLLGGSTDHQGNISTRCRGAEGHDQGRPCRNLHHRGKGGGSRVRGRGGSRGSGRLGTGFSGGLGRGFLSSGHLGGGLEPLTLVASSLTWPASKVKAESKEVQRSWSSLL